ncbi:MAG: 2Fe-2S iron-sulfur cluster binding domain-containing protein [Gammaproteobacteria bacterium]|nr:2Fe-2S iron-sulfur cluster binding domain-containing protein [Gammaproteobacteria bacterium]
MAQLLTLSRAARLVGISRGALQLRMKDGDLPTFEGKIAAADLLRLYPHTRIEQDQELERVTHIKETAFARRVRERILPDAEVLALRVQELGMELVRSQALTEHYREVLARVHSELSSAPALQATRALLERMEFELRRPVPAKIDDDALWAQDSVLRVMTAHVRTQPAGHDFFVEGNDSLLDAGLRAGLALNYGCSDGRCGRCKARLLSGRVKPIGAGDRGLTDAEHHEHDILLCANTAVTDLVIETAEAAGPRDIEVQRSVAVVKNISHPTLDMTLLHLQTRPQQRLRFLAGQFFQLGLPNGSQAQHPGAGCPCDERNLYFHVRRDGVFAQAVFAQLREGQTINIAGPYGEFALDQNSPRAVLFLAYGTGFAPIQGMIEHALALDNAPSLTLYWLAARAADHYLDNLCRSWADALDNFHYTPVTVPADLDPLSDAVQRIVAEYPALQDFDIYAAGPAAFAAAVDEVLATRVFPRAQLRSVVAP